MRSIQRHTDVPTGYYVAHYGPCGHPDYRCLESDDTLWGTLLQIALFVLLFAGLPTGLWAYFG